MSKNSKEIINIDEIIISEEFKKKIPGKRKMNIRLDYFEKTGEFFSPIILDKNNVLIDGYTSYLIAKKYDLKNIKISR